jgi:RNA polymerase sigma factor (TIGR02999 family)
MTREGRVNCVMSAENTSRTSSQKPFEDGSTPEEPGELTVLLRAWGRGDLHARDELLPLVYEELRRRAAAYLRRERADHTLQPTALIHEAYLRLVGQQRVAWQNRAQFYGLAAQMMRRILVDHARAQQATKRPAAAMKVTLDERIGQAEAIDCDLLLLNQALSELTVFDPRQAQIVELRYFGGLAEHEVAEVLDISRSTVTREWQTAKAWLYRRMTSGSP